MLCYYAALENSVKLTSLKVTFLLDWGSSTIFCKLAATEKREQYFIQTADLTSGSEEESIQTLGVLHHDGLESNKAVVLKVGSGDFNPI